MMPMQGNKQAILDAVSQALDAMGMTGQSSDVNGEEEDNNVPIWSQLQAGTLGQGSGPIHDKSALMAAAMGKTSKPPQVGNFDQYGMPVDDDQSEMMSALGLV